MKLGMVTDSLSYLGFDALVETASQLGLQMLEFACGNWSQAPHVDLDKLLEDEAALRTFVGKIRDHGLEISALNCSGNQLAPGNPGMAHDTVVHKTMKLASLLGVKRIVMMAGLAAGPGDMDPNWVTVAWRP